MSLIIFLFILKITDDIDTHIVNSRLAVGLL